MWNDKSIYHGNPFLTEESLNDSLHKLIPKWDIEEIKDESVHINLKPWKTKTFTEDKYSKDPVSNMEYFLDLMPS